MTALLRLARWLAFAPALLAAAALFAMMVMTFADVLLRSAFNAPIEAATELTRIFMAITVFAAMPAVSAAGRHITVDLTDPLFGPLAARLRDGAVNLICGAVLLVAAERVLVLARRAASYGDVTEYLGIPEVWPSGFIALATGVTALVLLGRGIVALVSPRLYRAMTPEGSMT